MDVFEEVVDVIEEVEEVDDFRFLFGGVDIEENPLTPSSSKLLSESFRRLDISIFDFGCRLSLDDNDPEARIPNKTTLTSSLEFIVAFAFYLFF